MNRPAFTGWLAAVMVYTLAVVSTSAELEGILPSAGGMMDQEEHDAIPPPEAVEIIAAATERIQVLDFLGAEQLLREGIANYPGVMQFSYMLAATMVKQNRYREAIELLEVLLQHNPRDHRLLNNLSWVFSTATDLRYRDPQRALQLAQDAILIAPGDFHVWSTLANAHYVCGNFQQAQRIMRQCLELAKIRNAPAASLRNYEVQMAKMNEAFVVMSLLE